MADDPSIDPAEPSAPTDTPPDLPDPAALVPCRHLRNKGMFVYNGGVYGQPHDDYDNTIYWCVRTMKGFGPDDGMASRDDCSDPERPCYEPF